MCTASRYLGAQTKVESVFMRSDCVFRRSVRGRTLVHCGATRGRRSSATRATGFGMLFVSITQRADTVDNDAYVTPGLH